MSDFEETFGISVNAHMASHMGDAPREVVDDVERTLIEGEQPVSGAQWDEVHRRWERWDEDAQAWVMVGDGDGDGVAPDDENPLTSLLARELVHADDLEAEQAAPDPDVPRAPTPAEVPPGAQWNEVAQRWERWDEGSEAWVEATET